MPMPFLSLLVACTLASHPCPLPTGVPDSVGMSAVRLTAIGRVAERGVGAEGFPGMTVVVGRHGRVVWEHGYGKLDWGARSPDADPDRTVYDLASLTKVVATTTAVMLLYDEGRLRLDDPVARWLPAFRHGAKRRITIRMLLEHRSGLPAGRELWRVAHSPRTARRAVLATPLEYPPGSAQLYSDLGADVLGFVVEAIAHEPLDRFVERRIFRPLGMRSTRFRPPRSMRARIAPTESDPPRGHPLRGEVQDESAWALGGVSGHAGLFGTAADLAVFAQMMLDGGRYGGRRLIRASTVQLFTRRSAGWRAFGWETCAGGASCGQHMSERAYGHTGYTGTSMWIDPDNDLFVIVLSNRVHERPDGRTPPNAVLDDVRADIADIAELSVTDGAAGAPAMPAALRADLEIGWGR